MPGSVEDPVILDPFQNIIAVEWGALFMIVDAGSAGNSGFGPDATAASGNISFSTNFGLSLSGAGGLASGGGLNSETYSSSPGGLPAPPGPPGSYDVLGFVEENAPRFNVIDLVTAQTSATVVGPSLAFANLGVLHSINLGRFTPPVIGYYEVRVDASPGSGNNSGNGACRIGAGVNGGRGSHESGISATPLTRIFRYNWTNGEFSFSL